MEKDTGNIVRVKMEQYNLPAEPILAELVYAFTSLSHCFRAAVVCYRYEQEQLLKNCCWKNS
jgi:hypothetical protein